MRHFCWKALGGSQLLDDGSVLLKYRMAEVSPSTTDVDRIPCRVLNVLLWQNWRSPSDVGGDTVRFPIVGGCLCFVFLGPPLKIAKLETKQWEEQQRTVSFVIIKTSGHQNKGHWCSVMTRILSNYNPKQGYTALKPQTEPALQRCDPLSNWVRCAMSMRKWLAKVKLYRLIFAKPIWTIVVKACCRILRRLSGHEKQIFFHHRSAICLYPGEGWRQPEQALSRQTLVPLNCWWQAELIPAPY